MAGDGGVQWPDQAVLDTWNRVHEVAAWVGGSEALTMAILTPLGAWVDGQLVAAQPARIRDLAAISPVLAVTSFHAATVETGPAVQGVIPTRPINLIELAQAESDLASAQEEIKDQIITAVSSISFEIAIT